MKARYVQRGDAIDYTPMEDVAAGDVVVLSGKLVGVAKLDIKSGELGALALVGVYEIATGGAAVALGDVVILSGKLVGVAKLDIKAGELGALAVVGVYEIATGGAAVALGDVVSVDPATGKVIAVGASGAVKFGHAVTAATASDATVNVRLAQGLA